MSVLSRFKDIISSNINSLLDRCEDPEKSVDKFLLDALDDLAEVKRDTADIMADEARCKQLVEDVEAEVAKYEELAKRALRAGNEDDARTLLEHKQECEAKLAAARKSYDLAASNADKMRQLHDKLTTDIESLRSRRANIKAKMAIAEAQSQINEMNKMLNGGDA